MSWQVISLDGSDWQVQGWVPYEWDLVGPVRVTTGNLDLSEVLHGETAPIPATVPGCTHADCLRAGIIEDPYWEFNSRLCEWISQRMWVYRRTLAIPAQAAGQRVRLRFEGIDYSARIFVNGQLAGRHEGLFIPAIIDITPHVKFGGENVLQVIVDPAPESVGQVGLTSNVSLLKPRFAYKWDFTTRLIQVGLSDSVSMHITGQAAIDEFYVHAVVEGLEIGETSVGQGATAKPSCGAAVFGTAAQANDARLAVAPLQNAGETPATQQMRAFAQISAEVDASFGAAVPLDVELFFQGKSVARHEFTTYLNPGKNKLGWTMQVPEPQLWWPHGMGAQPMYTARLRFFDAAGKATAQRETSFGIRKVQMLRNETADAAVRPYTLAVNGRKVFIKGYNWVPIEQQYGTTTDEKYRWMIDLARRGNVNMLRVWGGGLIEKEVFYRLCDEMGMLVWQEMPQSSSAIENAPAVDKEFCELLERTAASGIRRRGGHPCLVFWGGGNELAATGLKPLDETHPALAAIGRAVQAEHPNLIYIPTSPLGPSFDFQPDNVGKGMHHDVHGPWKYLGANFHYEYLNVNDCLFHGETGADGCASVRSMRKMGREELLWPPVKTNRFWVHHAAWWILGEAVRGLFGPFEDIATFVKMSQALQGEALRYGIESDRRRAWQCSAVLIWQLSEPWPNLSCTANVDYYGLPKQAYYVVRQAYQPVHVSLRHEGIAVKPGSNFAGQVFVHNDTLAAVGGTVSWRVLDASGKEMGGKSQAVTASANAAGKACDVAFAVPADAKSAFFVEVAFEAKGTAPAVRNLYAFSPALDGQAPLATLMALPKTTLQSSVKRTGATTAEVAIRNTGVAIAWLIRVEAQDGTALFCDANAQSLLPGESLTSAVTFRGETAEPKLVIGAFNADETNI